MEVLPDRRRRFGIACYLYAHGHDGKRRTASPIQQQRNLRHKYGNKIVVRHLLWFIILLLLLNFYRGERKLGYTKVLVKSNVSCVRGASTEAYETRLIAFERSQ